MKLSANPSAWMTLLFVSAMALFGQDSFVPEPSALPDVEELRRRQAAPTVPEAASLRPIPASYILGPDDEVTVQVLEAGEISPGPIRIGTDGYIHLPMAGRVPAAGLTPHQLEAALAERLKEYIREPHVAVRVATFRSQPVSVIGAVNGPGIHHLGGPRTLVEILSMAGGIRADAGHTVKITRRIEWGPIPLPTAKVEPEGRFSVAEVNLERVIDARDPTANVLIYPHDVVSVPRAEMVYVVGAVQQSGGFTLRERESLSVLQALALAGGLGRAASPKKARILRPTELGGTSRREIPIDLKMILAGQAEDIRLKRDDLLFVPRSNGKIVAARAAEAAVQIATGLLIWRR